MAALVLLAAGCTREQWHRFPSPDDVVAAVPWFAVMHRGIAIQPYKMPRQPVAGAIPVSGTEVVPAPVPQNQRLLDALANPEPLTAASIERGRDRYDIYCGLCHGAEGLGNGPVAPKLANAVRNLMDDRVRRASDGWIYGVVVHGYGALMPEHGSKIQRADRWHIVNYLRVLQGATP